MLKKIFCFISILCMSIGAANAQTLTATVSRTEIPYGETLLLVLDYDGKDNSISPDFSVLNRDFSIFSTSQSYSTRFINGKSSSSHQWQVALMPKHSGAIEIPAISMGNLKSNPIALNVFEGNINGQDGTPLYTRFSLDGEVDNQNPYVQQQINYTLTLTDAGGLQGNEPEFLNNNDDWIIKSIRQPTVENKKSNGVNVREIKFYYALFPQKSGVLETPAVQFNGFYNNGQRQSRAPQNSLFSRGFFETGIELFDMVAARSPVSLNVKPIKVDVKPIVPDFGNNWWIPAKNVILNASWDDSSGQFMVGQAISRTISLNATGVLETQLPDLKMPQSRELKQYPEKPVMYSSIDENGEIISTKEFTNVYIPQRSGKITIPAISLKWFDVTDSTIKEQAIPAQTIIVLPNPQIEQNANYFDFESSIDDRATAQNNDKLPLSSEIMRNSAAHGLNYVLFLIAFGAGILLSYILFGRKNSAAKEQSATTRDIIKYAEKHDFKNLRDALILWAKKHYKEDISNLDDLSKRAKDNDFSAQLEEISKNLYGKVGDKWKHLDFIKTFKKISSKKSKTKTSKSPLPKLYKH